MDIPTKTAKRLGFLRRRLYAVIGLLGTGGASIPQRVWSQRRPAWSGMR
ncbi:MAG: hypothetical protein ACYTAS_09295 [Planctomycetota bacterium]|jgi:hypothetical protein